MIVFLDRRLRYFLIAVAYLGWQASVSADEVGLTMEACVRASGFGESVPTIVHYDKVYNAAVGACTGLASFYAGDTTETFTRKSLDMCKQKYGSDCVVLELDHQLTVLGKAPSNTAPGMAYQEPPDVHYFVNMSCSDAARSADYQSKADHKALASGKDPNDGHAFCISGHGYPSDGDAQLAALNACKNYTPSGCTIYTGESSASRDAGAGNVATDSGASNAQPILDAAATAASGYANAKAIKHGNATYDPATGTTTYKTQADRAAEQQQVNQQQQALKEQRDLASQQASIQEQQRQLAMQQKQLAVQQEALARQQAQVQQQTASETRSQTVGPVASVSHQNHPSYSHEGIVRQDASATIDGVPGSVSDYVVRVTNTGDVRQNCTVNAKATLTYTNTGTCIGVSAVNCTNGRPDSSAMTQDVGPGETAEIVVMRYYLRNGSYTVSCTPRQ